MFSATGFAQFVEEVGTLESLYEARARAVLNSFLRPTEYTIVVSADIERDQKKLDDYREKMELQFIPGMPVPNDPSTMPATDDLHAMKNKVAVNLVLSQDVTPEKEALLKSVLVSKLHLDESSGDTIVINRAKFPEQEVPPAPPHILPEFSWKTWVLVIFLSLLAFAGLVFWLYSRRSPEAAAEPVNANAEPLVNKDAATGAHDVAAQHAVHAEEEAAKEAAAVVELMEAKDMLLAFVTQYPQISSKAVVELLERHNDEVVRTFEYLSWDLSRRLFAGLSPMVWGKLGAIVKTNEKKATIHDYLHSLKLVHRHMLGRFLEAGGQKDEINPFAFLFKLTASERFELLHHENASAFALISLYCQGDELSALTENVATATLDQLPIEISKLESIPESDLSALADRLKERLRVMKAAPSVHADGSALAAKILRSYSPEREQTVFERMLTEEPGAAERIRRFITRFEDSAIYPADVVSQALSLMDIDQLTRVLFDVGGPLREHLSQLLPPKRARMIFRDLETPGFQPSATEVATNRRLFCLKIEEVLALRGKTLADVWSEVDARAAAGQLKMVG